jgi:hypothetical protein
MIESQMRCSRDFRVAPPIPGLDRQPPVLGRRPVASGRPLRVIPQLGGSPLGTYVVRMSLRLDKAWRVLSSPSTPAVDRCVDIFVRPNGTFGFEEFRRDPEDMGAWTPIAYYSTREFESENEAVAVARDKVPWLSGVLDRLT